MAKKVDVSELQGPLSELFEQFSGQNGRYRFEEFKRWLKGIVPVFEFIDRGFAVPKVRYFDPRVVFGPENPDGIKFSVGSGFERMLGFMEVDVPENNLVIRYLVKESLDEAILKGLPQKSSIYLAHFYELIKQQPKGGPGLLVADDRCVNLCYVHNMEGRLWTVWLIWFSRSSEWHIDAYISHEQTKNKWNGGSRVVSSS